MELKEQIRKDILQEMDMSREYADEEIYEMIEQSISRQLRRGDPAEDRSNYRSIRQRVQLEEDVFNSLRKLDVLQKLLDDEQITEIMVNGPARIFYEKGGRIWQYDGHFSSEEKLRDIIQTIVGRHNRVVNQANPIVDTHLADGSRVNIVLSPISIDGSAISIRKFPKKPLDMNALMRLGAIEPEAAELLKVLVRARYSIFISGGTGSGKTTFLNALSQYIPPDERIITIEDSAELQLLGAVNLIRLETRNANIEGVTPISIRDLIRTALRMRPDRIIVGECRGEEALDMLTAMNTGHDGSLSTGHANSCKDILSRLETMVIMGKELPLPAIRSQIASGIDIIVQLGRLRDKSRRVLEIVEILGVTDGQIQLNPLFRFEEDRKLDEKSDEKSDGAEGGRVVGHLLRVGRLMHREKLMAAGLVLDEEGL